MAQTSHLRGNSTHVNTPNNTDIEPTPQTPRPGYTHPQQSHRTRTSTPSNSQGGGGTHTPQTTTTTTTQYNSRQTSTSRSATPAFPHPTRQNLPMHDAKCNVRSRSNRSTRAQPRRHIRDLGRLGLHTHPQRLTGGTAGQHTHTHRHRYPQTTYHRTTQQPVWLLSLPAGRGVCELFGVFEPRLPFQHPSLRPTRLGHTQVLTYPL